MHERGMHERDGGACSLTASTLCCSRLAMRLSVGTTIRCVTQGRACQVHVALRAWMDGCVRNAHAGGAGGGGARRRGGARRGAASVRRQDQRRRLGRHGGGAGPGRTRGSSRGERAATCFATLQPASLDGPCMARCSSPISHPLAGKARGALSCCALRCCCSAFEGKDRHPPAAHAVPHMPYGMAACRSHAWQRATRSRRAKRASRCSAARPWAQRRSATCASSYCVHRPAAAPAHEHG